MSFWWGKRETGIAVAVVSCWWLGWCALYEQSEVDQSLAYVCEVSTDNCTVCVENGPCGWCWTDGIWNCSLTCSGSVNVTTVSECEAGFRPPVAVISSVTPLQANDGYLLSFSFGTQNPTEGGPLTRISAKFNSAMSLKYFSVSNGQVDVTDPAQIAQVLVDASLTLKTSDGIVKGQAYVFSIEVTNAKGSSGNSKPVSPTSVIPPDESDDSNDGSFDYIPIIVIVVLSTIALLLALVFGLSVIFVGLAAFAMSFAVAKVGVPSSAQSVADRFHERLDETDELPRAIEFEDVSSGADL